MKADVSVIVPLYNAKHLVKYTVDSLLNQTLENIEVVIIDDCSTDGSLEFCRELYGQDQRVVLLKQAKNAGPGAARNTGIRSASGEYVVFCDSDDEIMPDTYRKMFEIAKKFDADVVQNTQFLYPMPDEEGKIPLQLLDSSVELFPFGVESGYYKEVTLLTEDLAERLEKWTARQLNWSVCSKMIRREFLLNNGIAFSDMKLAEDMVFCFECLFKSKNYVVVPGGGYAYRISASSLSRGKKSSAHVLKALRSQMGAVDTMSRILDGIPFFVANPDKARIALERVLDDLEVGYIRPAFQELGEEKLRSDNIVHEFMQEKFGDKAPYVEFLFYELHKNYEEVFDFFGQVGDMEAWKVLSKKMRDEERAKQ